jgi:P4 family phage/plasmid primase-like protien
MRFPPEFIETVTATVVARRGRHEGDEIRFACPDPSHHANGDAHVSAHLNVRKLVWHCPVGGIGGGLKDLAQRLGIPVPARIHPPALETFAQQRGLTVAALASWGVRAVVHAHRPALRYPTPVDVDRVKFSDRGKPKYTWVEKGGRIHWYGLARAVARLRETGSRVLYLVNGEPSVWAADLRGVAAVCLCGGEGAKLTRGRIAQLEGALTGLPSVGLRVVFDVDQAGRQGAAAARRALRVAGFSDVQTLDLAAAVPDLAGADVGDLQRSVGEGLAPALAALPVLTDAESTGDSDHDERSSASRRPSVSSLFGEDGCFVPAWAGKHLLAEAHILLGHDRRLWRYDRGVYRPDGDDWAKQRIRDLVGDAFRRQQLEQVGAWLHAQLPSLGQQPPMEFINCRNGLLDWRTGALRPHTPAVLSTSQIPIAWKPQATCLAIRRFFAETLPWDTLDLIEELFGYALYPGNPFRKAVLLYGSGFNGKSVLLGLFRELLGSENVSAVPLQMLGENRFAGADLFGKLANICGDLDARAIEHTDLFKQATGSDVIRTERKFREPFDFKCGALPLFSANELPRTADQTDAWFDRWIIIPMRWRFAGAKEDPALAEKLTAELDGLLVHAVSGLRRLMARRRFELPASIVQAGMRYRQTLDTVRAFVVEECHFEPLAWTDRAALYRAYRAWCTDGGRYALAAATFNQHLTNAFSGKINRRKRIGRPGWLGIGLGPGPDEAAAEPWEEDDLGDRGDEGDAAVDPFPPYQSQARARGKSGERLGTASPSSPSAPGCPREPGEDDEDGDDDPGECLG